eukprot:8668648-Heterocapsa_arctica.AAC.1
MKRLQDASAEQHAAEAECAKEKGERDRKDQALRLEKRRQCRALELQASLLADANASAADANADEDDAESADYDPFCTGPDVDWAR